MIFDVNFFFIFFSFFLFSLFTMPVVVFICYSLLLLLSLVVGAWNKSKTELGSPRRMVFVFTHTFTDTLFPLSIWAAKRHVQIELWPQ